MIIIVTVWLCLITHVACDVVITINNNGSDSDTCCVNGTCPCSSLLSALHNVSDNTVINITSKSVTLHDIVGMGSGNLNNIMITGNGATIMCNNAGGVYCESCSDITIMGIIWYQCGHNDSTQPVMQIPGLRFTNISNMAINNCTFLRSSGCPVFMQYASGNISIVESNFVANVFDSDIGSDYYELSCSGLLITYNVTSVLLIHHTGGRFEDNGWAWEAPLDDCNYYAYGIVRDPFADSEGISGSNQFVFENITFTNNSNGLYLYASVEYTVMELSHVNVHNNNGYGINVIITEDEYYFGDVYPNDEFMLNMSSVTFINNANALFIMILDSIAFGVSINIVNCAFVANGTSQSGIIIESHSATLVTVSNSMFHNFQNGAVSIEMTTQAGFSCFGGSITFITVTIYGASQSTDTSVCIETKDAIVPITFKNVNFISNQILTHTRGAFLFNNHFEFCYGNNASSPKLIVQLIDCNFYNNTAIDHVIALALDVVPYEKEYFYLPSISIELSGCNLYDNHGGKSIIYVNVPNIESLHGNFNNPNSSIILNNSTFSTNKGTALYLVIHNCRFEGNVLFINNSASSGAAVYMEQVYVVSFDDNTSVQFINNSANERGGAMYINPVFDHCDVFKSIANTSNVSFTNNSAGIAGGSIFFNIPQTCKVTANSSNSLLPYPNKFKYSQPLYAINSPVVTTPANIKLCPPAVAIDSSMNYYIMQESKMLGEPIQFIASVFDYFSNVSEPVIFSINCITCVDSYVLSTYQLSIHDHSIYELKIFPVVSTDVSHSINISINLLSALPSIYKYIHALLSIKLSPCRAGYLFDKTQKQCICYSDSDLVHCKGYYVEIKIGYWIGYLKGQHYTSSICPNNYCSSELTETSPGYYSLHGESDDQCSLHRTGVACGKCKSGYTLAYDSPDCINTHKSCSAGMTILVIVLTILYWIAIVAVVFGLMYFQFQISSGYAYGIIYFYSIVDILLVNDVSKEVSHLVSILSSFAKLTPELFGQLCLVEGLSGIDQQFIHYSHALAVSLILLIIVLAAKRSGRLTRFVGPSIIRVICVLLLLSYTSLASTSLQLLRPLKFDNVGEVRTYLSPYIQYFTGRHLVYAIVAILCEVIIVIGLPLFLLLEPFLRQRVNLIRIKPLLDQFQGCYKDKYRWFAAYYLICRQVIILIVYVGNGNYYYMLYGLQTACVIIAMVHGWVQPYKNNFLNGLDEVILLILVLVVNLNLFSLSSFVPTNYLSIVLVILPLLLICFVAIKKLISHFFNKKKGVFHLYNPVETHEDDNERR